MKKGRSEKLVMTGLMTALVMVVTAVLPIPMPFSGGYIHLGDSMIFLAVIILGWKAGGIAAAVGSAFADLYLGVAVWAPWTFLIKGGMALILGLIIYQGTKNKFRFAVGCVAIGVFWVAFNFLVRIIIGLESSGSASLMMERSGTSNLSELGDFITQIENWLMATSLAIPIFLIVLTVLFARVKRVPMPLSQILGMSGAGLFMVMGYYIADGFIYGNFAVGAFGMPFNILQFLMGFVIAVLISTALSKTPMRGKMEFYVLADKMKQGD